MSGYKYSAKPRLRSPKVRADAWKLKSEVAVNFTMPVALDSPVDEALKICFQKTTVAICGLMVFLKVMQGRVESKRETWSDCDGTKDLSKVRQCAIVDRRLAIDHRQLRRTLTTWETNLDAHRTLERKKLTKQRFYRRLEEVSHPTSGEKWNSTTLNF